MEFNSYALNEEELKAAQKLIDKTELEKSMEFSVDVAGEALAEMKEDLEYFLESVEEREKRDAEKKKEEAAKNGGDDVDINPFSALFGLFGKAKKEAKKKGDVEVKDIKKDNFVEKTIRGKAISGAAGILYTIYDVYKKAHRMASAPGLGFDSYDSDVADSLEEGGSVGFTDIFKGRDG